MEMSMLIYRIRWHEWDYRRTYEPIEDDISLYVGRFGLIADSIDGSTSGLILPQRLQQAPTFVHVQDSVYLKSRFATFIRHPTRSPQNLKPVHISYTSYPLYSLVVFMPP